MNKFDDQNSIIISDYAIIFQTYQADCSLICISFQNNLIDSCWWLTYTCTYKHSQVKTTTKQGSTADGVLTIPSLLC